VVSIKRKRWLNKTTTRGEEWFLQEMLYEAIFIHAHDKHYPISSDLQNLLNTLLILVSKVMYALWASKREF
jgi:hypothetical protein